MNNAELDQSTAARRGRLLLADVVVTVVVGVSAGFAWGFVPAIAAVLVMTTAFHLAGKRLGLI